MSNLQEAATSATHLCDAIYAVQIMVQNPWSAREADRARNALDWISASMNEECDKLHDALDEMLLAARTSEGAQ